MASGIHLGLSLAFLLLAASGEAQRSGQRNTCPESCPDSIRPVCGTNNRVYRNLCTLQRAACNSNIRKKNDGPCVSSKPPPSPPPSPASDCIRKCRSSFQPVCANNGVTYDNKCQLSNAACADPRIKQQFEGVCPEVDASASGNRAPIPQQSSSNVASVSNSRPSGSSSGRPSVGNVVLGAPVLPFSTSNAVPAPAADRPIPVVNTPRPVRNCEDKCNPGFRPVCGSDGQVYGNECKLRVAICKNPSLGKRNDGVCEKDCSIDCRPEVDYVCASNGETYLNGCEYQAAKCKDPSLTVIGNGHCAVFRDSNCQAKRCDTIYEPVCGSDGNTYDNLCSLQNQVCADNSLLRLHNGICQSQRCQEDCPQGGVSVCGSDGLTYPNHCTLIRAACLARADIIRVADGPCRAARG